MNIKPSIDARIAHPVREWAWRLGLCLAVLLVYLPAFWSDGWKLQGADYLLLHRRRIDFVLTSLAHSGTLPAWYPRELLGTPFWANTQDFPFVPTRLAVLPFGPDYAFTAGILLAAVLSAIFTFQFLRRLHLSPFSAALAGWTFAAAGTFASRVMAGHLPLLEAYPSLPLLLWLIERCATSGGRSTWRELLPLGVSCTAVSLCGHPQLSVYSLVMAGCYAMVRLRGRSLFCAGAAMFLGVLMAAFSLVPMLLLVGRSTRVLDLEHAANDFALPYSHWITMVLPWHVRIPASISGVQTQPVSGAPASLASSALFWDTFNYVGVLPLVACAGLLGWCILHCRRPRGPAAFLVVACLIALALTTPTWQSLGASVHGTILRSPCRLMYVVVFGLSVAIGAAANLMLSAVYSRRFCTIALAILTGVHAVDLFSHSRVFIRPPRVPVRATPPALAQQIRDLAGDDRVAIENDLSLDINRRLDDIGFFDSIMLARSYQGLIAMCGLPPRNNVQMLSSDTISTQVLATLGVRATIGMADRSPLNPVGRISNVRVYAIPPITSRATFYPATSAGYTDDAAELAAIRGWAFDWSHHLLLPPAARPAAIAVSSTDKAETTTGVDYERPSPDEIVLHVHGVHESGFVRVIESFDPGWSGTVNGQPATIYPADYMLIAVPVPIGEVEVRLTYTTPGWFGGMTLSGIAAIGLLSLCGVMSMRKFAAAD